MANDSRRWKATVGGVVAVVFCFALVTSLWPAPRPQRKATESEELVDPDRVRPPAVAGRFYPEEADQLQAAVDGYLARAAHGAPTARAPVAGLRAIVVPHAAYRFSGPVAASAYRALRGRKIETVFVLAPSHHVPFAGVSVPDVDAYRTPLGLCHLSPQADELRRLSPFTNLPHADDGEHSLEVQLPFLQRVLGQFQLAPLVFGKVDPRSVADALAGRLSATTLVIASSDLSHYHPYGVAALARTKGWRARLLDYRDSSDTAGERDRVVGYASIAFYERT